MKNAAIFHGTGCDAAMFWYPWLKEKLIKAGYHVWLPSMPETDKADLDIWSDFVQQNSPHKEYDLFIGHSAGCPLILHLLNHDILRTRRAALVAGFLTPIPEMAADHQTVPKNLDYTAIKQRCDDFVFIHADNDPWGCDHHQGEALRQAFGGNLVVATGAGHFGSGTFNQPYERFPLLESLCLEELP